MRAFRVHRSEDTRVILRKKCSALDRLVTRHHKRDVLNVSRRQLRLPPCNQWHYPKI